MKPDDLTTRLWPEGDGPAKPQVHLLIDGARDPAIAAQIRFGKLQYECLFGEPLSPRLRAAAPYLVHLSAGSPQTCALLERSASDAGGVFVSAPPTVSTRQLRLHFKKLLWVRSEQGRRLYFRFYDPRVLSVFMPTCSPQERLQMLGPAERLYCVQDGRLNCFSRRSNEFGSGATQAAGHVADS